MVIETHLELTALIGNEKVKNTREKLEVSK